MQLPGDCRYSGEAFTPRVMVEWMDPKTNISARLEENVDYLLSYSDNVNAGDAKVTVTGLNKFTGTRTATFKILPLAIKPTVKLKPTSYTYNKKARKPSVTVTAPSLTLKKDQDYSIKYASGRKNPGKYSVTVTGKGNYSFKVTKTFKINPKGTTISKLKAAKKKCTVKWKKQSSQTSGYIIKYYVKGKASSAKTKKVKGAKKTSAVLKKLKSGKTYVVSIQTYKTVKGKSYKSKWSKTKKVKIK